jgi:hypothetical protein
MWPRNEKSFLPPLDEEEDDIVAVMVISAPEKFEAEVQVSQSGTRV